jgi:hypothetical protein
MARALDLPHLCSVQYIRQRKAVWRLPRGGRERLKLLIGGRGPAAG